MKSQVLFVRTAGDGSMDRYAEELGARLPVRQLVTDVYQRSAEVFNAPFVSAASLRAAVRDVRFLAQLWNAGALLHLPNHHLGRYGRFLSRPYVITVHDLIRYFDLQGEGPYIHRPNARDRLYLRADYAGIRRAAAVIAVSEATKRDAVRHLGLAPERVHVTYLGVDHARFRPVPPQRLGFPYVLFVGSEHPRKNLATLLAALRLLKAQPHFASLKLVKIGKPGGSEAPFREQTLEAVRRLGLHDEIVFLGHVPDEEMASYYAGACALVLPSLYEGFGFPPVEAMASGCPVIVSDAGSLPEVVGDAGLIVPARDAAALARALSSAIENPVLAAHLRRSGLTRAAAFTWERTAAETVNIYERVLEQLRGNVGAK